MRISADSKDPGYALWLEQNDRSQIRIFLDGVSQRGVVTADDAQGLVVRTVYDADGRAQVDPANPEEVWIETVHGTVRIELPQ